MKPSPLRLAWIALVALGAQLPFSARAQDAKAPLKAEQLREGSMFPIAAPAGSAAAVWQGWNGEASKDKADAVLGRAATCKYKTHGGGDAEGAKCAVSAVAGQNGGVRLVFVPPPPAGAASIEVRWGKQQDPNLTIPIENCSFSPVPPHDALLGGAKKQLLSLQGSAVCQSWLSAQQAVTLRADGVRVNARVMKVNGASPSVLELDDVPSGKESGNWTLESSLGEPMGTVAAKAAEASLVVANDSSGKPKLDVRYDHEYFNNRQIPVSVDGYAVVTRDDTGKSDRSIYVRHRPDISVSDAVARLERAIRKDRDRDGLATNRCTGVTDESSAVLCRYDQLLWLVTAQSWKDIVWLRTGKSTDYERQWEDNTARIDSLGDLEFLVVAATEQPLRLRLELKDPTQGGVTVFETEIVVASAARRESLPMPISEAVFVSCGDIGDLGVEPELVGLPGVGEGLDIATHGTTRAINEDHLTTGQCRIHYSPLRLLHLAENGTASEARERLAHFGFQELEVVVRRSAAGESTITWQIDPTAASSRALPMPVVKNDTGLYAVSAKHTNPNLPSIVYRGGAAGEAQRPTVALDDLEFRANLRPRGRHPWVDVPIRTFITLPVEFVGVRLPANPRELRASSDDPNTQVITGRAGAVIALEPWNYDTGSNPLPIPTRLMTGFMFFQVAEGRFAPTYLLGGQLTFPLIDLPKGTTQDQLGVDAALGLFWEHDLREGGGDHLLLTMGLDVLSLFGSK